MEVAAVVVEETGSPADEAVAVIATTVFLSGLAHGLTASPLASSCGRSAAVGAPAGVVEPELPVRGLPSPLRATTGPPSSGFPPQPS